MSRILIVDDKELMRDSVASILARKGHSVVVAPGARAALAKIAEKSPDVVVTDLQMPEMNGLDLLEQIRAQDEHLPVVFMTAYGTVETAVQAMKRGAFDYLTKPFSGDELVVAVDRAVEHGRLVRENQILRVAARGSGRDEPSSAVMIGSGARMTALRERLAMIADSHGTVLITGASGTGKEVAANWIHQHSPRADQPFLAINCAALSTSLLESELFGHEKGAFTGADKLRKGRFELADGGTLLLDEISEISPSIQAKLLRVLQERSFERVGSSTSKSVDVRLIATSNRCLPEEVRRGGFRDDLFFRLNVLPVEMPALRDRLEDVPELAAHFLGLVATREGRRPKRVPDSVIHLFQQYDWPGNVRELQNICERAAVLTSGDTIAPELVMPWLAGPRRDGAGTGVTPMAAPLSRSAIEAKPLPGDGGGTSRIESLAHQLVCDGELTLERIEREVIVATLEQNEGHRQRSAKALGIGVRTLGLKLKRWKELNLVSEAL